MKERRALIAGLAPTDPSQKEREKAFVYGSATTAAAPEATPIAAEPTTVPAESTSPKAVPPQDQKVMPQFAGRVPVTTRARPEVASALKRASLTRQLDGVEPFYVQDIMEVALENWLRQHGYMS